MASGRNLSLIQEQQPDLALPPSQLGEISSSEQRSPGMSSRRVPQLRARSQLKEAVTQFQEKYGLHLQAEWTGDHRFLRIIGSIGQGESASFEFHPSREDQVRRRAQEILASAHDLLDWRSEIPLEVSRVSPGQVSAQVYFKQKFEGQVIEPVGQVKMDLGPHGELIALYSGYVSGFTMKNQRALNQQQALEKLFDFLKEIHREPKSNEVPQSVPMIWVQGDSAYYANQYRVMGLLIVMNAQTGEILFSKDIRVT